MFSGKNAKTPMVINYQPGNSVVNANFNTTVGAGKEIALMHLHGCTATQDAGAQYLLKLKESDLFKKIPVNIRKLIVNFTGGASYVGDLEILRGDILDVVELRGGDQLKGTLKEESFNLDTFYGGCHTAGRSRDRACSTSVRFARGNSLSRPTARSSAATSNRTPCHCSFPAARSPRFH